MVVVYSVPNCPLSARFQHGRQQKFEKKWHYKPSARPNPSSEVKPGAPGALTLTLTLKRALTLTLTLTLTLKGALTLTLKGALTPTLTAKCES